MGTSRRDVVTASEIAAWAWCPEAWRLEAVGAEPANLAALAHGATLHEDTSNFEVLSKRVISAGVWLFAVAVLAAALCFVLFGGAG